MGGLSGLSGLSGEPGVFGGAAFSPLDVSGLVLWINANDISTLFQDAAGLTPVTADDDVIGRHNDKSAEGNDATQSTTARKPTYKTNIQNSLPVARYDNTDDFMSFGNILNDVFAGAGSQFTIFVAIGRTAGETGNILIKTADSSFAPAENERQILFQFSGDKIRFFFFTALDGSAFRGVDGSTVLGSAFYIVSTTYDGTIDTNDGLDRVNHRINGSDEVNVLPLTAGALGDIQSSTSQLAINSRVNSAGTPSPFGDYANLDIAELLIYQGVVSSGNIVRIENYLNDEWGVF